MALNPLKPELTQKDFETLTSILYKYSLWSVFRCAMMIIDDQYEWSASHHRSLPGNLTRLRNIGKASVTLNKLCMDTFESEVYLDAAMDPNTKGK